MVKRYGKITVYVSVLSLFLGLFANVNAEIDEFHMHPMTKSSAYTQNVWKEFYVSNYGSDENDGTKESPFKTIEKAQSAVKEISDSMTGDIIVHIGGGYYFLNDRLTFSAADSGKNGYRIYYSGEKDNKTVLSGGEDISGKFVPCGDGSGLWEADVESTEKIRELYVNEKKSYMADSGRAILGIEYYNDKATSYATDGLYVSKKDMGIYSNPQDAELVWTTNWKSNVTPVEDIMQDPSDSERVIVKMKNSFWNVMISGGVYSYGPDISRPFVIRNVYELLDEPGEFYYDRQAHKLYYMPRQDEDMNTAEVIVPRLEQMIRIVGDDVDKRVKNITFENLKIAHCTWYAPGDMGFASGQAQSVKVTNDIRGTVEAAVRLDKTDGINFYNNYFFGLAGIALDFENAVSNSNVTGNAFSDIGDAAFVTGREWHGEKQLGEYGGKNGKSAVPPTNAPSQLNLINGYTKVAASYYGRNSDGTLRQIWGSATHGDNYWTKQEHLWMYEKDYTTKNTWMNDPYAPQKGEKSWVRYDFDDPYSISSVVLGFDVDTLTKEQRSGFEILLSNDKYFNDGNYVVAATQKAAAGSLMTYRLNTKEKYRYMMIRTIGATDFGLSGAWVFTPDKKLFTRYQRNTDNNFSNNYITRCGDTTKSGGISAYYNERCTIAHNEISKIPWSGISFGWGWEEWPDGSSDNKISNNYIHDVNRELLDGGGIYTLGNLKGSIISENYIDNCELGNGALYPDHGTKNAYWTDNVVDNSYKVWHVWISKIWDNSFLNTYATNSYITNEGSPSNRYNGITTFPSGNPCAKAYAIMKNAGLTDEYSYVKEAVYDGDTRVPEERERYFDFMASGQQPRGITMLAEMANIILDTDNFGNLPGQYAPEYKEKINKARQNMINAGVGEATLSRMIELKELLREAKDSVTHLGLADMAAFCEEQLNSAGTNGAEEFKKAIDNAYAVIDSEPDTETEYAEVIKLEQACKKFVYLNSGAEVLYVNLDGAEKVTVDSESKTVTAVYPPSASLRERSISVVPLGTAENAATYKTVNLDENISLPIYSEAENEYAVWTLKSEYAEKNNDKCWTSKNDGKINTTANSSVILAPQCRPAMNKQLVSDGESLEISFKPVRMYDKNNIVLIFGAATYDKIACDSEEEYSDRYELELSADTSALYFVKNGVRTMLGKKETGIASDMRNDIKITAVGENGGASVAVNINGKDLFDVRNGENRTDGYFGFYNRDNSIEITGVTVK